MYDREGEKKWGFVLSKSVKKAQENPIFEGLSFYLTSRTVKVDIFLISLVHVVVVVVVVMCL